MNIHVGVQVVREWPWGDRTCAPKGWWEWRWGGGGTEQAMKLGREKRPVHREGHFVLNLNHLFLVL